MKLISSLSLLPTAALPILLSCTQEKKPNVILILTDDQGYGDLSCHGSPDVLTPNIDRLQRESISLTNFHVSPTSSPTRAALMTGNYPFRNGVTHTILDRERMSLKATTLAQVMKSDKYTTGIFGKWHLGDQADYQPNRRGFDEMFIHGGGGIGQKFPITCADAPGNEKNRYFDPIINHNDIFVKTQGFCTDVFFAQALSWMKQQHSEGKPFFAYISTNAPHGPFIAPEKYKKRFADKGYSDVAQGFLGMVENIDNNVGLLLEKLDDWEMAENTIVIMMNDNGRTYAPGIKYNVGMRAGKGSVYQGGTRAFCFIRWLEKIKKPAQSDELLAHIDILPTIAEMTGIDISHIKTDGKSFWKLLQGKTIWDDRTLIAHTGRWKKLSSNGFKDYPNFCTDKGTQQEIINKAKYNNCVVQNSRFSLVNNKELYHLPTDPSEKNNVIDKYPEEVQELRKVYDAWWKEMQPYLVNENIPMEEVHPYHVNYYKQEQEQGIPLWEKPNIQ